MAVTAVSLAGTTARGQYAIVNTGIDYSGFYGVFDGQEMLNDHNQLVYTELVNNEYAAFIYSNGIQRELPPYGPRNAFGGAINDSGVVAGDELTTGIGVQATVWSSSGGTNIGVLPGGIRSEAYGINEAGVVVGNSTETGSNDGHAFRYTTATGMVDLGTLGGEFSEATGINSSGWIIGNSYDAAGNYFAALWINGVPQRLTLAQSSAAGINDHGQIVGHKGGAAVLDDNGTVVNLNSLLPAGSGWNLENAWDINNRGTIVGLGTFQGQTSIFMMTDTPEPGPCTLVAGLCLFGSNRRHRRVAKLLPA